MRALQWAAGTLVVGTAAGELSVWNFRPLRADVPELRSWLRERCRLEGMAGVCSLGSVGNRLLGGGSEGAIYVFV